MLTMSKNESSKLWQEAFCDSDTLARHCFTVLAQTLEEKGRHRQEHRAECDELTRSRPSQGRMVAGLRLEMRCLSLYLDLLPTALTFSALTMCLSVSRVSGVTQGLSCSAHIFPAALGLRRGQRQKVDQMTQDKNLTQDPSNLKS